MSRVLGRNVTVEEADHIRERYLKEGEHYRRQGQGYSYEDCVLEHLWDVAPDVVNAPAPTAATATEPPTTPTPEPEEEKTATPDAIAQEEKRKWLEKHGTLVRIIIDEGTGISYRFRHDGRNYRIRVHPRWTRQRPMRGRKVWVVFDDSGNAEFHGFYMGRLVTDAN